MSTRRPRHWTLTAGMAAALPIAALAWPAAPGLAASQAYAPSESPLLLTRVLRRALAGGLEIVTRRNYEIWIVAEDEGYRVEGRQIDCAVEVPPGLEALAALERGRVDTSLFPIRLDQGGMMRERGAATALADRSAAAQLAGGLVARAKLSASEQSQAQVFVNQFRQGGPGLTIWPRDLFNPAQGQRNESRSVALADGSLGYVTVTIEAHPDAIPDQGSRFERTVITDLGGTQRTTREEFRISPLKR